VWFSSDNLVLTVAQSACVLLPAAGLPRWAVRYRTGAWALILPLSIAVVIGAITLIPSTADVLTWVALVLVPIGCALALGWAAHRARWPAAALAAPLLAVAWATPHTKWGQGATAILIAGSAVTAGRLVAGVAPLTLLKVAVVAMAVLDSILVFSNNLQPANDVLVAASPGAGLPQLQSASFGFAGLGYGDFFAAAVVGGILAAERRAQWLAAPVLVLLSLAWDQLFLYYDTLPATVPPAVIVLGCAALDGRRARRRDPGDGSAPAVERRSTTAPLPEATAG
jgi:hypothetical protein